MPCSTSPNTASIDESKFWDANGVHWTTHRIGWAIAGGCAILTVIVSLVGILQHCRNYTNHAQQRQIQIMNLIYAAYLLYDFVLFVSLLPRIYILFFHRSCIRGDHFERFSSTHHRVRRCYCIWPFYRQSSRTQRQDAPPFTHLQRYTAP